MAPSPSPSRWPPPEAWGAPLLALARGAIAEALGAARAAVANEPWLLQPGASFVTLTAEGRLRGCIGTLEPRAPLHEDVRRNAVAAAFGDPRFQPLAAAELGAVRIEVSLLSRLEDLPAATTLAAAAALLRPGVDGAVLALRGARGVFLPQVWSGAASAEEFLRLLRRKAHLPPDGWDPATQLARFAVAKWAEAAG